MSAPSLRPIAPPTKVERDLMAQLANYLREEDPVAPTSRLGHIDVTEKRRQRPIVHPKPGVLDAPVIQRDDDTGIWRVRLLREVSEGEGLYMGKPLTHQTEVFLDGLHLRRTYGNGRITKDDETRLAPMAAITAARTKDVIDYGRFISASTALVRAADAAGPDPSPEQLESLLQSYQGLLAWRQDLTEKIQQIDGALDIAAAKVRKAIG